MKTSMDLKYHQALAKLAFRWLLGEGWQIVKLGNPLAIPFQKLQTGNPDVLGNAFVQWYRDTLPQGVEDD